MYHTGSSLSLVCFESPGRGASPGTCTEKWEETLSTLIPSFLGYLLPFAKEIRLTKEKLIFMFEIEMKHQNWTSGPQRRVDVFNFRSFEG